MKTSDYIIGYGVPGIILGYLQIIICVIVSYIIAAATGVSLSFGGVLLNFAVDLPVIVVMTAIGILFGSILSDKSAPGVSSAIITISAVLGGAWMPLETIASRLFLRDIQYEDGILYNILFNKELRSLLLANLDGGCCRRDHEKSHSRGVPPATTQL